jgi:hypothetical protein
MEKVNSFIHRSIGRRDVPMRTKVLTLCLVLLMTLLPLAMQSSVAPPGLPALSVTVEEVSDVESDPVEYVHVQTTATVTVENFPLGATVTVNATAETWVVDVSPTEIEVPSGQTSAHAEIINLNIRVPPRASAERPVELRVVANTTTALGFEYEDVAFTNISIKQFYGVRLSSNGTMSLDQGKNLTARMRITNNGNGQDNYTIALNNGATLSSKGLTVTYDESVHEVGRDRTVSVVIQVLASNDADIGNVDALFTVRSVGDGSKSDTWMLSITIKEGENGNGGNGGNGNGGTGEEDDNRGFYIGIGIIVVVLVLFIVGWVFVRRAEVEEAEDEDYVVGKDRDADDR